jgi:hypothetical protein
MIIKQYKVTLLSDIVLNASLATEGNMESLDYISGSNFLGIVASHYDSFGDDGYDVFHNGKVIFGNAYVSKEDEQSFPIPIDIMRPKDEKRYPDTYYLNHSVDHTNDFIKGLQLKQQRVGYLDANGKYIKEIPKTFAIKSAHNAKERRSDEGKMFGFESLKKGSEFIFYVRFSDERLISKVEENLVGTKRLGKSKSAEFGSVKIESVTIPTIMSSFKTDTFILIYAASNLCFIDEDSGQPTLKPSVMQLTGQDIGKVDWSKSSIRTYTYSPYNGYRKTTSVQRDCIAKGSVFYIDKLTHDEADSIELFVGEYQSEGLGHVIINPKFLEASGEGKLGLNINEIKREAYVNLPKVDPKPKEPSSNLGMRLLEIEKNKINDRTNAEEVNKVIKEIKEKDIQANKMSHPFSKITSSQWGAIRQMAEKPNDATTLFSDISNFISKGVAFERHWDKDGGKARTDFLKAINGKDNVFIVKLTSEIAKHINSFKSKMVENGR